MEGLQGWLHLDLPESPDLLSGCPGLSSGYQPQARVLAALHACTLGWGHGQGELAEREHSSFALNPQGSPTICSHT